MPIELWWETNLAGTPRKELGMVSPELPAVPPGEQPRPSRGSFAMAILWPSSGWWSTGWCACSTRERGCPSRRA